MESLRAATLAVESSLPASSQCRLPMPTRQNLELGKIRPLRLFVIILIVLWWQTRQGVYGPADMNGGCFSISSLGGIGGRYFTPIINAPEVAIMGVCKGYWKQHSGDGKTYSSRLTLPLSLSWDHRVIDGAAAARFNVYFANVLADMRRVLF